MRHLLFSVLLVSLVGILMIPNAFAENVPDWVKNTAGWWATDAISETEFVNAVEFLVKENIIQVNVSQTSETSQGVPSWVKNTAGWWATDAISETEFVNAIAFLIKVGIISIESSKSPELIAEMWVNGNITDDEFLAGVEHLIEKDIITIQSDSITKTSQLPDWLVNNAGWWAARIFTNSDFNFDPAYLKKKIYHCDEEPSLITHFDECDESTHNSHGFRGPEITKEKSANTYRIFAVGGSTTWGTGAQDDETWPAHLQQIINEKITDMEVEVINAGISGNKTDLEYDLIKDKLSIFDPDLIIMYDGYNDYSHTPIDDTIQNWNRVCKLGKSKGFDTIIIVQPLAITGQRVLTEQETVNSFENLAYPYVSQQYVDAFEELDKICTKTADFRRIFDYVHEPIFWDSGHTISFGNKIIAENVFSVISPIYFGKTYSVTHILHTEKNESGADVVYAVGSDLSGRNFDNLNLQNAVFDKADLSNASFKNANIDGARFVSAKLVGVDLSGKDLTGTILRGADLTNSILTGVNLAGMDLTGTKLVGADLSGKDLTGTLLRGADLTNSILTGVNLAGMNLTGTKLVGVDLSGKDLTGTKLSRDSTGSGQYGSILADLNPFQTGVDISNSNISGVNLAGMDLTAAKLVGVDLSGKNLTESTFDHANFADANLENVNLSDASFVYVDLTKIKNKSLAGAKLFKTSLAHSNLSGVNLAGAILAGTNFWKADLSGLDFTVISEASIEGVEFQEANLSNSNFEGVDLSPKTGFFNVFKNKAHLNNLDHNLIVEDLFSGRNILIISTEVRGNDLAVTFFYFTNFRDANLEDANFKNADLRNTSFYSASLVNADLSGADLSNANLEGTNLLDADLTGVFINENTILKCKNHPICNS